jgi:hypothetical protein
VSPEQGGAGPGQGAAEAGPREPVLEPGWPAPPPARGRELGWPGDLEPAADPERGTPA